MVDRRIVIDEHDQMKKLSKQEMQEVLGGELCAIDAVPAATLSLPPTRDTYYFDEFESFRTLA